MLKINKIMLLSFLVVSACNASEGIKAVVAGCRDSLFSGKMPGYSFYCSKYFGIKVPNEDEMWLKPEDRRNCSLSGSYIKDIAAGITRFQGEPFRFEESFKAFQLNQHKPIE